MNEKSRAALDRLSILKNERSVVDRINREVIYHIAPDLGIITDAEGRPDQIDYLQRMRFLLDTTPMECLDKAANGLYSGVTPPSRPWSRLAYQDPELMENGEASRFLDHVNQQKDNRLRRGDFYSAIKQLDAEVLAFGTAVMLRCPIPGWLGRYKTLTWGQYWLGRNEYGLVDSLFRRVWMSARNMEARFGRGKLSTAVKNLLDNKRGKSVDTSVEVVHALYPRKDRDGSKADSQNMEIESLYFEAGASDRDENLLEEGGFKRFPAVGLTWNRTGNNCYGSGGPGWKALPVCKGLQDIETSILKGTHLQIDPPTVAPTSMQGKGVNSHPGGRNYLDSFDGQKAAFYPLFQTQFNLQQAKEERADKRSQILKIMFVDVLMMAESIEQSMGGRVPTATQILEMKADRLQQLGPFSDRLENDVLDAVVMMEVEDILEEGRMTGSIQIPQEVQGRPYVIEYEGIMSQATKEPIVRSIDDAIMFRANLLQVFPGALDGIDVDKAMSDRERIRGLPAGVRRGKDEVAQIRAQRQQEQQQQMEWQAAQAASQGIKDMGSVGMDPANPNLVSTVAQGLGLMEPEGNA